LKVKSFIKKTPVLRDIAKIVYFTAISPRESFNGSDQYWKDRYKSGGNSGAGSYDKLAKFKAEILNNFVKENKIKTVIEYGCGDGNQLQLAEYPSYIGFDISSDAVERCKSLFLNDKTKSFKVIDDYANETANLTLSLDVIYHLVEDDVFISHMNRLFDSSKKFVMIYSSNVDEYEKFQIGHVRHRQFSKWVDSKPEWKLIQHIPNIYPFVENDENTSCADFYIYEKI
jgi:SAM-dependent methyltransferase